MASKQFLTVEETAKRLGMSRSAMYRAVTAGQIASIRGAYGRIAIPIEALDCITAAKLGDKIVLLPKNKIRGKSNA